MVGPVKAHDAPKVADDKIEKMENDLRSEQRIVVHYVCHPIFISFGERDGAIEYRDCKRVVVHVRRVQELRRKRVGDVEREDRIIAVRLCCYLNWRRQDVLFHSACPEDRKSVVAISLPISAQSLLPTLVARLRLLFKFIISSCSSSPTTDANPANQQIQGPVPGSTAPPQHPTTTRDLEKWHP
jgi:hypothetical protein